MASWIYRGVDVSNHNGIIDWTAVSGAIDFAIIRSSYGLNTDSSFFKNVEGAWSNNVPFGLYHAAYPLSVDDAVKEGEYVVNLLNQIKDIYSALPSYGIYYDFEEFSVGYMKDNWVKPYNALCEGCAIAFCDTLQKNGYYAGIYGSTSKIKEYYLANTRNAFDLWVAHWNSLKAQELNCGLKQYSNLGKVDGINGNVDVNVAFKDYPSIIKNANLNGW